MNSNTMPENLQKFIEDFFTLLEREKDNPESTPSWWQNLETLEENLRQTEDRPAQLAKTLADWCQGFNITLDREELDLVRANMLKQGKVIPKPTAGEKPEIIYNQALIVETIQNAREEKSEKAE